MLWHLRGIAWKRTGQAEVGGAAGGGRLSSLVTFAATPTAVFAFALFPFAFVLAVARPSAPHVLPFTFLLAALATLFLPSPLWGHLPLEPPLGEGDKERRAGAELLHVGLRISGVSRRAPRAEAQHHGGYGQWNQTFHERLPPAVCVQRASPLWTAPEYLPATPWASSRVDDPKVNDIQIRANPVYRNFSSSWKSAGRARMGQPWLRECSANSGLG